MLKKRSPSLPGAFPGPLPPPLRGLEGGPFVPGISATGRGIELRFVDPGVSDDGTPVERSVEDVIVVGVERGRRGIDPPSRATAAAATCAGVEF